MEKPGLSLCIC